MIRLLISIKFSNIFWFYFISPEYIPIGPIYIFKSSLDKSINDYLIHITRFRESKS